MEINVEENQIYFLFKAKLNLFSTALNGLWHTIIIQTEELQRIHDFLLAF
jgi:hypothetical protein